MIRIFKTSLSSSSDSPEGLTTELGQQTSPGRRGFGPKSSGRRSPGGGASILANKRLTLPFLAFVAVLAAGLLFLMPGGLLQAQDSTTIEYAENGEDAVATFTAVDPEGATPITWSLATTGQVSAEADLGNADNADATHFTIDKDRMLKFTSPPDFENPSGEGAASNTYKVVVAASDAETDGETGYHKVTVTVTNVNEPGKVTLRSNTENGTPQYLVGAILTATASDGDITNGDQDFTADRPGEVTGVAWRWYRGGTEITGTDAQDNTYTLLPADAGQHIRAVVYYIVTGNVDQEMAEETTNYPVLMPRVGVNQLEFDPAAVSRTISEGDKGRNVGAPVTATGNHGTVRYTLSGTDSGRFEIDEKTGQITTDVDLDYEAAANAEDNCATTQNSCSVTVTASDSTGESTSTTATNLNATVTIMLTDVDEKPAFDGTGSQTVSVPENSTVLYGTANEGYSVTTKSDVTYTAMDPEGRTVNYSLTGPDASKFQINGTPPVLSFASKPDFEAKASADRDNVYMVTVRASVDGDTGERMVRVTVGDEDEGPDVSGPSTRNFAENGEDEVATFTAVDPEGATPISWTIAEAGTDHDGDDGPLTGADAADATHFTIDKDRMLKFTSPPDFENPSGEGAASNTYKVVVAASDAETDGETDGETGYHKVTVTVTNVNEPGKVTLRSNTENGTPQYLVGAILTATASDGDITNGDQDFTVDRADEVTGVTWQWYRGGTLIPDENSNEYTLLPNDADNPIRVLVRYQVAGSTRQENVSLTTDYPVLAARVGDNQLKFDPAAVSRTISEGDKGRNVGAPVTATGNHGTVRYTLSGTDSGRFEIDEKTGQITTDVDLDYEAAANAEDNCATTQNSCSVTVTASDSTGESTSTTATNLNATVTIMLTDVDEKPAFDGTGSQTVSVPENSTVLYGTANEGYSVTTKSDVTYTAMDPEGRTVNYSLTGPDASKFQISGTPPVLSFASKPDFEAKASADRDNVYMVTVRASVDGDTGERMVRVTVGDVDEPPEIMERGLGISGPSSVNYAEGHMDDAVGMFTARGPMKDMARWTLEGADARYFMVGTARGAMTELMFRRAPDYEMPRGRAMSDTNTNTYMVTLKAYDGTNMDTHDVTVMVTNTKEDGTVTLSSMTPAVGTAVTATLTDPDGSVMDATWVWETSSDMSTWAAGGGTETTSMDMKMSTYTPVMADDGMYLRATATYTDGYGGDTAMKTTTSAVVSNNVPMFAEGAAATRMVPENSAEGTNVGAPVTATDADSDTLTYMLSGDDAMYFDIDNMGQITVGMDTMLDYEAEKMTYMVTVTATDPDSASDSIMVTIKVTNMKEDGMVTLSPMNPVVGTAVTANLTDPDGGIMDITWQWSKSKDGDEMSIADGVTSDGAMSSYTPVEGDDGYRLMAKAMYTDGYGEDMATATTGMVASSNSAPEFGMEATTREVAENTAAGMNIGAPVMATDADDDTLTYTLGGSDMASFDIDAATGQLMTKDMLDYEMPRGEAMSETNTNDYMVTVTATDPDSASASIMVTIRVTDVEDELVARYDTNGTPGIQKDEVITAINDYLFGEGDAAISKADVIRLINMYLLG